MSPTAARAKKRTAPAPAHGVPPGPPAPFVAHLLVPPHELLSEEESRQTLELLGTPIERLPKILVTDPGLKTDPKFSDARQAHEALNERLVRVRRPSSTAGEAVAYRVIVQSPGD